MHTRHSGDDSPGALDPCRPAPTCRASSTRPSPLPAGADHFESLLIDYEPTANWGNWVAAAGLTGGRLNRFNIVKQSNDYDKEGEYIRHWIPELAKVRNRRGGVGLWVGSCHRSHYGCRSYHLPIAYGRPSPASCPSSTPRIRHPALSWCAWLPDRCQPHSCTSPGSSRVPTCRSTASRSGLTTRFRPSLDSQELLITTRAVGTRAVEARGAAGGARAAGAAVDAAAHEEAGCHVCSTATSYHIDDEGHRAMRHVSSSSVEVLLMKYRSAVILAL